MSTQTVLDPTNDLVEQAKRVLPGGSFGNMPAEVVLQRRQGRPHLGREPAASMSTTCWARGRCSSATPIPR